MAPVVWEPIAQWNPRPDALPVVENKDVWYVPNRKDILLIYGELAYFLLNFYFWGYWLLFSLHVWVLGLGNLLEVLLSGKPNTDWRLELLLLFFLLLFSLIEFYVLIKVWLINLLQILGSLIEAQFKHVLAWVHLLNHLGAFLGFFQLVGRQLVDFLLNLLKLFYISFYRVDALLEHLVHFGGWFHELVQIDGLHHQMRFVHWEFFGLDS